MTRPFIIAHLDLKFYSFGLISERIRNDFGSEVLKAYEIICQTPEVTAEQMAKTLGKTTRTIESYMAKFKKNWVYHKKRTKTWRPLGAKK
jgi:predicted HTH transcriptional regulator